jgi:hypothetical protein
MAAEPIPISSARKPFRRDGLGYVWELTDQAVEVRADYLHLRNTEIHAQVAVTLRGRHLHMANFNLSSTSSRKTLRIELRAQTEGHDLPWDRIVEQFCVGVLTAEREGESVQRAGRAERRRLAYLIDNLVIQGKTNMLFAPGGSGKGMVSVGLCAGVAARRAIGDLTVMTATPIYFDWEDDFETFEDRLNSVATGMGVDVPDVAYKRMRGWQRIVSTRWPARAQRSMRTSASSTPSARPAARCQRRRGGTRSRTGCSMRSTSSLI